MIYIFIDDACSKRQFKFDNLKSCLEQNISVREKNGESVVIDKLLLKMFEKGIPFETLDLFQFFKEGGFIREDDQHDSEDSLYEPTEITGEEYLNELFDIKDCKTKDICLIIQGLPMKYNENYFSGDAWYQYNILSPLRYYMYLIEDKVIYTRGNKRTRQIFNALSDSETFNERLYELCKETVQKSPKVQKQFPIDLYKKVFRKINKFLNGLTTSSDTLYKEVDDDEFEYYQPETILDYCCFYENEKNKIMKYQSNRHKDVNFLEDNRCDEVFKDPYEFIDLTEEEYERVSNDIYGSIHIVCPEDTYAINERCHMVVHNANNVCPLCKKAIYDGAHQVKHENISYQQYFNYLMSKNILRQFKPVNQILLRDEEEEVGEDNY